MRTSSVDDVEIDECPGCGTRWFDDGELAEVIVAQTSSSLQMLGPSRAPSQTGDPCPVCSGPTVDFRFHAAPRVHVAACAEHGQWLDARACDRLCGWGRKEASLVNEGSQTPYQRRVERAHAVVDHLWGCAIKVKWTSVLVLALRGARFHVAYLLIAIIVAALCVIDFARLVARWCRPKAPSARPLKRRRDGR